MKVHIITGSFILLELKEEDGPTPEELGTLAGRLLASRGLEPWPSVEAECFSCGGGALIFLSPVRVYLPAIFSMLLGDR